MREDRRRRENGDVRGEWFAIIGRETPSDLSPVDIVWSGPVGMYNEAVGQAMKAARPPGYRRGVRAYWYNKDRPGHIVWLTEEEER